MAPRMRIFLYCGPYMKKMVVIFSPCYLAPGGGCEVLFSPGLSVCLSVCLWRVRRLTCNKSMAYLKNWTDNFFQIFFMGTSWVAVSINNIKTRASSEMTSRKNIKIFDFNGVNVVKHWHVAGEVYAITDCIVIHMSALLWGPTALKFSFTWVRYKGPQDPLNMNKTYICFNILGLNLKMSYQIASLFDMYIDMGKRIAGKQDRLSPIIEDPPQGPLNAQNIFIFLFWPIYEKLVCKLFPLVVHMSPLWWGLHLLTFRWPWYPWILCRGPTWPRKKRFFFIFFILTQKVLIRLLLYIWHVN